MKTCSICKSAKSYNEFYKASGRSVDGFRSTCKICHSNATKITYQENKEKRLVKSKQYYQANKVKRNQQNKEWYRNHPDANNRKSAAYRARKLNATPNWLNASQKSHIKVIYELANILNSWGYDRMDVDHIVPLKGENVCGLHVGWNLQIVSHQHNIEKRNKHE